MVEMLDYTRHQLNFLRSAYFYFTCLRYEDIEFRMTSMFVDAPCLWLMIRIKTRSLRSVLFISTCFVVCVCVCVCVRVCACVCEEKRADSITVL